MTEGLYDYSVPDTPKMLRETLCMAQTALASMLRTGLVSHASTLQHHMDRLGRLIDECDRHTPTCGCEE